MATLPSALRPARRIGRMRRSVGPAVTLGCLSSLVALICADLAVAMHNEQDWPIAAAGECIPTDEWVSGCAYRRVF